MEQLNEILSFDSLKIGYGSGSHMNLLLPPLSASARRGELIAVIGKNGIGKSTLLRTLAGLQKPLGGAIKLNGKNLKDYSRPDFARLTGYISTEIVKVTNMTVYDLVALGRFPHTNWIGRIESSDHNSIMNSLDRISMRPYVRKYIAELSDGERQKIMIARILAQDAGVMIMDEPTAFLDVAGKYEIFHLLNTLAGDNNKTVIFSTHDLQMAVSHADKIWLILEDRLIEGAPEDLMLSGIFGHLFDSDLISFNPEEGTFSLTGTGNTAVNIEGSGLKRKWTEKGVSRAGFIVSENAQFTVITPDNNRHNWVLKHPSGTQDFKNIYDLINTLKKLRISLS